MFYCNKGCQTSHWKAGHKLACRAIGDIRPQDIMLCRPAPLAPLELGIITAEDQEHPGNWLAFIPTQPGPVSLPPKHLIRHREAMNKQNTCPFARP